MPTLRKWNHQLQLIASEGSDVIEPPGQQMRVRKPSPKAMADEERAEALRRRIAAYKAQAEDLLRC